MDRDLRGVQEMTDAEYLYMASNLTARQIIKREYGEHSRNLITPRIISYGKITPGIAYEISEGTDFNHNRIWGISIAQLMNDGSTIRRSDLSCMIREYQQVREYVRKLKGNNGTQGEKLFEPQTVRAQQCK
jgi:hypothetical protein